MGLFRTVSKINGDFSRKLQIFTTHTRVFNPAAGLPLELGDGAIGSRKLE